MINLRNSFIILIIIHTILMKTILMNVITSTNENININAKNNNNNYNYDMNNKRNINNNNNNNMNKTDEYMLTSQKECFNSKKILSCFKYKTAKFLWSLATNQYNYFINENMKKLNNDNKMNLIQLTEPSKIEIFTDARSIEGDSEFTKAWKFIKRMTQKFLQNHAIQFPINNSWGARVDNLERTFTADYDLDSRGDKKKKKWLIILPLIILMKIAHLKMTVVPLLLGVAGLQLITVLGGAYIIYYLKRNTLCKIHPHLIHTHSHVWDSEPEYSSFVGNYHNPGQDHMNYGNDWGTSKAYRGYNYLDTISRPA